MAEQDTDEGEFAQARDALAAIPDFRATVTSVTRMAGLTNRNYKVTTPDGAFVLRLPGHGTSDFIDRRVEQQAAQTTADIGVNAEVLSFDPETGIQLCRFLEGARPMDANLFTDLASVARAGKALRRVHDTADDFLATFDVFEKIDEYQQLLRDKSATLPSGYGDLAERASAARDALSSSPIQLRPCHCDPLPENFLDTGERMYIIDWEYAGQNDPMWDLGDLSVEAGFTEAQDQALLEAYFGTAVPRDQLGRVVLYKALCDLLWTLWGVLQHVNGNPAEDFWAYANERFERCGTLMARPDFTKHIEAVRA